MRSVLYCDRCQSCHTSASNWLTHSESTFSGLPALFPSSYIWCSKEAGSGRSIDRELLKGNRFQSVIFMLIERLPPIPLRAENGTSLNLGES